MVDVFISYSRENKARVADIAAAVTAAGYDVWWDAELPPHRSYGDVITEKIGYAKAAIVVWSHASAQSEWVRAEADDAVLRLEEHVGAGLQEVGDEARQADAQVHQHARLQLLRHARCDDGLGVPFLAGGGRRRLCHLVHHAALARR